MEKKYITLEFNPRDNESEFVKINGEIAYIFRYISSSIVTGQFEGEKVATFDVKFPQLAESILCTSKEEFIGIMVDMLTEEFSLPILVNLRGT